MAAVVSLEQVLAAYARGALSFDHRFAGWVALQAARRLAEIGGGVATQSAIEIDESGGVRIAAGTRRADEYTSARSLRELLDVLLQHATSSTPALRLCACRPEKTGLDGVERELAFALSDVDRDDCRRVIAETATRVARGPAQPIAPMSTRTLAPVSAPVAPASSDTLVLSARLEVLEEEARSARASSSALARAIAERDAALTAERERARLAIEQTTTQLQREIDARDVRLQELERRLLETGREHLERVTAASAEDARRVVAEQNALVAAREAAIAERDAALASSAAARAAREEDQKQIKSLLAEKERARLAIEQTTSELRSELEAREQHLAQLEARLAGAEKALVERVAAASAEGARRAVAERNAVIAQREAAIAERDALIADREARIAALEGEVPKLESKLAILERKLAAEPRAAASAPDPDVVAAYEQQLKALRESHVRAIGELERERDRRLAAQEARLRDAEARLNAEIAHRTSELDHTRAASEAEAARHAEELRARDARVRDAEARVRDADARARDAEARMRDAELEVRDAEARVHDAEAKAHDADTKVRDAELRVRAAEVAARDAEARATALGSERGEELERVRAEALARAEQEHKQQLAEIAAAGKRRLDELRSEHTRALAAANEERARHVAAIEADRDRRLAALDASLAESEARLQHALVAASSGNHQATSELEAAHARALAEASRKHAAALAEAESRSRATIEQLERKLAAARDEAARALDGARAEALQAQLQARTEVLRGRDDVLREAEQRHAREVQSALERLRRTMSEDAERARADAKFAHDTELATLRAEHEALKGSLERQVNELEQQLFRALADRDAERMLRIDVESSSAKKLRDVRRRTGNVVEDPPRLETKAEPKPALTIEKPPVDKKREITPEPASVAPVTAGAPPGPKKRVVPIAVFTIAGGLLMTAFAWTVGFGPFAPAPRPAAASTFVTPAAASPAPPRPFVAPVTCEATLKLANLPKGSEVLRRVGRTPVSSYAPMHVPLEVVVTRDGYAPTRLLIDPSAPWKLDLVPTLSVSASLDASSSNDSLAPWPATKNGPRRPPVIEPSKGMLTVSANIPDADVFMSVPEEMRDVPCGAPVDLLLVRPLGTVERVHVDWSVFRGSPPSATHTL